LKTIVVSAVLLALYLLHFDFWLWQRPELILGLPVGLLYHVVYCVGISVILALLLYTAWQRDLTAE